jgi:hypothetical protein
MKDFPINLPETDAEVFAAFKQLYDPLTARNLTMLYKIQREEYGKSVRDAYKAVLMMYLSILEKE